jgi:hypothetical protein
MGDKWGRVSFLCKGTGTGGGGSAWHYDYSGGGTATTTTSSSTGSSSVTTTESASGEEGQSVNYQINWVLGTGEAWIASSGSGTGSGSGDWHWSSTSNGSYTKAFDGGGVLSGTSSGSAGDNSWYSASASYKIVNGAWVASGGGTGSGSSFVCLR